MLFPHSRVVFNIGFCPTMKSTKSSKTTAPDVGSANWYELSSNNLHLREIWMCINYCLPRRPFFPLFLSLLMFFTFQKSQKTETDRGKKTIKISIRACAARKFLTTRLTFCDFHFSHFNKVKVLPPGNTIPPSHCNHCHNQKAVKVHQEF